MWVQRQRVAPFFFVFVAIFIAIRGVAGGGLGEGRPHTEKITSYTGNKQIKIKEKVEKAGEKGENSLDKQKKLEKTPKIY